MITHEQARHEMTYAEWQRDPYRLEQYITQQQDKVEKRLEKVEELLRLYRILYSKFGIQLGENPVIFYKPISSVNETYKIIQQIQALETQLKDWSDTNG